MDTQTTITEIKKELHAAMNGVAATRMRESGMSYRMIFGVELPRLREIASGYTPSRQLAQALWNQPVRECKLLACMLMPEQEFLPEVADIWLEECPTTECVQVMAMCLLSQHRWSAEWAFRWVAADNPNHQLAGLLVIVRLLSDGAEFNPRSLEELHNQLTSLLPTANLPIRKAVARIQEYLVINH
ncbi:MAG: DNA alkylation repair protein [Bacteroidaceae bacterium]|nr:DNA alkylation repair protein [Bacteroidaceae bacterium]